MEGITWDKEVDALVVGSGAGGMAAALTAREEGLDVLLVEKTGRIGGSTAISGGALWIPLNAQTEAAGHPDSFEKVWTYLEQTVGAAAPDDMKRAYLEAGPRMMDYLVSRGILDLAARTASPDYYPDLPGAAMGGRSLDPLEFDGRKLGGDFRFLRDPLKEFTVLGGMMVNITDVRHLLRATRSFAAWRHSMKLVLRYAADRARGYRRGTRLLLGNALAAQLFHGMLARKIEYWLDTPALALHRDAAGRVLGAAVRRNGKSLNIRARRGVVMATGGFPWDPARRAQSYPQPTGLWSMSPRDNAGDGIRLSEAAGAALGSGHASPAFWAPVSLLESADGKPLHYPHLVWDRAKPGLIAVNGAGRRFVNESASYHEFVQAMYRSHGTTPSIPAFLICDQRFIDTWGLGLALPGGRPRQHLIDAGYLLQAGTLAALAARLGVPADALQATVERYNTHAAQGQDPDFGKGSTAYNRYLGDPEHAPNPCLAPLAAGPYYAVKVYPGDIGTACGIAANPHAQALDATGAPIAGLYVAGNDMQSVMGGAYPGPGITLGPALTFGWIAGQHLAHAQH
ncbi:FAD-dependent oxidoreductase [Achromobacter sp. K91]|uniref:FAD-binding protein n=1 Tax=Achromobacter TaxID=222 RepID=UPI000E666107|nr:MULTISPECIES: FAD-binding protein [Achromobacter]MBD9471825.1 FAD-binding protein [Achromobacter sp. ACM01]RII99343.1 FAD-dependent oxidoreductase [Achromobacter sp. K91]CAB3626493.1 3-oxosteroid 1-dehydrogenase [Achromobacter aegrifaciens]CAB3813730.1 3-oxosteroid 1-dehydrogenase [Achromobacter aegrifaciens]